MEHDTRTPMEADAGGHIRTNATRAYVFLLSQVCGCAFWQASSPARNEKLEAENQRRTVAQKHEQVKR
jgi:hypothetical protein